MLHFDLDPGVGIGPLGLGMSRGAVRDVMASVQAPLEHSRGRSDYFLGASIQVEFEPDETASFIAVNSGRNVSLFLDGHDLFDMEAAKAFELLAERDRSGEHRFNRNEYIFPSQLVTLWEADEQYDRRPSERRIVWGQIGAGDQRYLAAILEINQGFLNPERQRKA